MYRIKTDGGVEICVDTIGELEELINAGILERLVPVTSSGLAAPVTLPPGNEPALRGQYNREKVERAILDGLTAREISDSHGVSAQTVYSIKSQLKKSGKLSPDGESSTT